MYKSATNFNKSQIEQEVANDNILIGVGVLYTKPIAKATHLTPFQQKIGAIEVEENHFIWVYVEKYRENLYYETVTWTAFERDSIIPIEPE
jgi:hypothetical protein